MADQNAQPRFTILGKLLSIFLIGGLVALGAWMILGRQASPDQASTE